MVTVVFVINSENGFDNFQKSYANISTDCIENKLCVVAKDKDLTGKCQAFVKVGVEALSVEVVDSMSEAIERLDTELTVLVNENVVMPLNCVDRLAESYKNHKKAGLVSGEFNAYPVTCWLEDLYNNSSKRIHWGERKEENTIVKVDTIPAYCFITPTELFREHYPSGELEGLLGLSYGIRLRRLGYQNYVDTKIKLGYGG